MHIKTQGIVLRETNYKETDKILTVLTGEGGKRTVKARACRRRGSRLAASAQLLAFSDLTLFEYKDFFTMDEADPLELFWGVRSDIEKLSLCSYFAEVTETVAEEGRPQPELLSLLLNSMYALDKLNKPLPLVKAAFELKLLCLVGYEPMVDACAVCGLPQPESPVLDLQEGVLHCARCPSGEGEEKSLPLSPGSLAAIQHVVYGEPKRLFSFALGEADLEIMGAACEAFLLTQLDRGFHTLDFYRRLNAPLLP